MCRADAGGVNKSSSRVERAADLDGAIAAFHTAPLQRVRWAPTRHSSWPVRLGPAHESARGPRIERSVPYALSELKMSTASSHEPSG